MHKRSLSIAMQFSCIVTSYNSSGLKTFFVFKWNESNKLILLNFLYMFPGDGNAIFIYRAVSHQGVRSRGKTFIYWNQKFLSSFVILFKFSKFKLQIVFDDKTYLSVFNLVVYQKHNQFFFQFYIKVCYQWNVHARRNVIWFKKYYLLF